MPDEQDDSGSPKKRPAPNPQNLMGGFKDEPMAEPHADYRQSLYRQQRGDPDTYGALYGAAGAATGGTLAALLAQAMGGSPAVVGGAALAGAAGGGYLGHQAGKGELEAQNSRLLALRRFGINTPGELELLYGQPLTTKKLLNKGVVL